MISYLQKNIQPQMQIFLLASLLILTMTAGYVYLLKKPLSEYLQAQQTLTLLDNELQTGLSLSNLIKTSQQSIAKLDKQLYGTNQQLPINQIIAFVIGELDQIADKHNVKLVSVKPGTVEKRQIFQELPFNIELSGSYLSLYAWLNDVENTLGPIVVQQFTINPENLTRLRKMQLTIVSYRFEKENL